MIGMGVLLIAYRDDAGGGEGKNANLWVDLWNNGETLTLAAQSHQKLLQ